MQTHAIHLCKYLQEHGYSIEVATYRGPEVSLPFPVHRCLSRIGHSENLRILQALVKTQNPDLLYASTVFFGRVSELTGVPMVARSAGNDVLRPWIVWPYKLLSRTLSRPWIEHQLCERFRRMDWPESVERLLLSRRTAEMRRSAGLLSTVLANSGYTEGLLQGLGVSAVRVLPGGVDASRFRPAFGSKTSLRRELGLPESAYILLTACRAVPKKGLDLLLRALPKLDRDMHLVVAGEGRQLKKCQELATQLGVADRVTFAGRVAHDDLHRYYWSADQFVLASREHIDAKTGLRDVETMGRVLCEAHAAGVPVVASESGGIPSIVQHERNGLLFRPDDVDDLARCINRVRHESSLASRMTARGLRDASELWDWSVICQAHEEAFQKAWKV